MSKEDLKNHKFWYCGEDERTAEENCVFLIYQLLDGKQTCFATFAKIYVLHLVSPVVNLGMKWFQVVTFSYAIKRCIVVEYISNWVEWNDSGELNAFSAIRYEQFANECVYVDDNWHEIIVEYVMMMIGFSAIRQLNARRARESAGNPLVEMH